MRYRFLFLIAALILLCSCENRTKKDYSDLPKELAELWTSIDASPEDPELYYKRSQYYYDNGRIDDAMADILQSIKLDSLQSKYYVGLSDIYFSLKQTDDSEEALQKAIALDPQNNEAYLKLSELYFHLRMFDECNATLDNALKLQNHNPKAHLIRAFMLKDMGDTLGCIRMLQLAVDQDPKEIKAYLELGYIHQQKNDPLAITYYRNALAVDPKNKEILFNLALALQDMGEIEEAKQYYNAILELDADNIRALFNLGFVALIYDKNYNEAVAYFTRVLEQEPDYVEALVNRGIAFEEMKRITEAREDYNLALKFNPNFQPAIDGLNRIH